jgi:hypothetical protein
VTSPTFGLYAHTLSLAQNPHPRGDASRSAPREIDAVLCGANSGGPRVEARRVAYPLVRRINHIGFAARHVVARLDTPHGSHGGAAIAAGVFCRCSSVGTASFSVSGRRVRRISAALVGWLDSRLAENMALGSVRVGSDQASATES